MGNHATRLKSEIDGWLAAGLIDTETAGRLHAEVESRAGSRFGFASVLAAFAALLFAAAILLFVAANWEAMPRLLRLGLILLLILLGYGFGAVATLRGYARLAEAGHLVGIAAFGGGMALIGQMYHLSGDEAQALLVWCGAAALSAAMLRSSALTAAAVVLATVWMWSEGWDIWRDGTPPAGALPILAMLWALSLWTRSAPARHVIILSLSSYVVLAVVGGNVVVAPALLAAGAAILFVVAVRLGARAERVFGMGGMPVHAMLAFGLAMVLLHHAFGDGAGLAVVALLSFAACIGALVLSRGADRAVRWLAYLGFGVELCLVYVLTIGTMLGTAGFLLASGLLLALTAFVVLRFERRFKMLRQTQEKTP
ncbi:DUF2157 domain-containing protein [Aquibium sp. ELW1220]|uniref:DUF2157 domain-containing protein n=1 Tax=Aquibium sp. ELW1220 TaxID=2976766 RepID=UPI0025AF93F1|nr:DUF2157 domain-containing protein [Aquibium sp. ELW1220]MDN2582130.1 DUF2157 domain-containing protein [Aquibium sp. ELW1220]